MGPKGFCEPRFGVQGTLSSKPWSLRRPGRHKRLTTSQLDPASRGGKGHSTALLSSNQNATDQKTYIAWYTTISW